MSKQFTLYWLDGTRNVIKGDNIEEAFTQAGYGAGAVRAVDFYIKGDNHEYVWNKETHRWDRKEPLNIGFKMVDVHSGMGPVVTIEEKKYKLFVSHNLGANYFCEYSTNDKDDPELTRRIEAAKKDHLRFYVKGDDTVVCPQHEAIINAFGGRHEQRNIEEQAALLRGKFCK